MQLPGKVFVVTGASSGIGAAIARELCTAGCSLVVTARRAERLQALVQSLPGTCAVHAAAIEDPGTAVAPLELALARYGRVDGLINNAGIFVAGSFESIDLDALAQMTRVNFDAAVCAAYVFARHLAPQRSGAIINVSSVAAYLSSSSVGAYSGLKHALEVFTTALRVELAPSGVRVGSIAPGTTATEIFDHLRIQGQPVRADGTPPLEPADIAAAVRFMLEQPDRANVARMLLVSSAESA